MSNLSGKDWWHKNEASYPNSREIGDLAPGFKEDVARFVKLLRAGGAKVKIRATRRHAIRAYLMHFSWCIAHEELAPSDVPSRAGVDIVWDHGNPEESISASRDMVELFGLAYRPALKSNHIRGLAVDMNIRWSGELFLGPLPDGSFRGIVEGARNGAHNEELHGIGELFSVYKLRKDPPHWSSNGR